MVMDEEIDIGALKSYSAPDILICGNCRYVITLTHSNKSDEGSWNVLLMYVIFDNVLSGCVSTRSPPCWPTSVTTASWGSPVSARRTSWSSWTTSPGCCSAPAVARTSAIPGTWWSTSRMFTPSTSTSFVMIIRMWKRSSNSQTELSSFLRHFTTSYFHLWSSD